MSITESHLRDVITQDKSSSSYILFSPGTTQFSSLLFKYLLMYPMYRVYCNLLDSSSLSMVSLSAAASTTSEFCEEERASEATCEDRVQESSVDESDEKDSSSSENGDVDDEHMQQVCVKFTLSFSRTPVLFFPHFRAAYQASFPRLKRGSRLSRVAWILLQRGSPMVSIRGVF